MKKNSSHTHKNQVGILGAGFAGKNLARLLAETGITCTLFDCGFGASNFWAGTVDTLTISDPNPTEIDSQDEITSDSPQSPKDFSGHFGRKIDFKTFQHTHPRHPYQCISESLLHESLIEFDKAFPSITLFQENNRVLNRRVLTTLGKTKLSSGIWHTLFHQLDHLTDMTRGLVIEFSEFDLSAAHLLTRGLEEYFPGTFRVMSLSLSDLFTTIDEDYTNKIREGKISTNSLAKFFDTHPSDHQEIAIWIKKQIHQNFSEWTSDSLDFILFPPVLGIKENDRLIHILSDVLQTKVHEFISLSPSITANRLIQKFDHHLNRLSVMIHKNLNLDHCIRTNESWACTFDNRQGKTEKFEFQKLVIACGSIFNQGLFEDPQNLQEWCMRNNLHFPLSIGPYFEVLGDYKPTNLFVIGSANFIFDIALDDEEEIENGTGLGLAISSSYCVAQTIKKKNTDI